MYRKLPVAALWLAMLASGQDFKPGSKVGDFTVADLEGRPVRYAALKGDLTVVMFVATKCPVSNGYNERMKALYGEYSARGVKFLFINANATEPAAEVAEHAREHGFTFPVYKDPDNVVADRFHAQVTPEAFVMDATGAVRYHGYIDDSQNPARIQKQGLRMALDAVLANQAVAVTETKAFGCTIRRQKKTS